VLFIFSIFLLSSTSFSQILPNMGLNIDKNATFKTIQTAMNDYWTSQNVKGGYVLENGIEKKVPNWKLYKRWEYYWEQRVNQTTGEFPNTTSVAEYEKYLTTHNTLSKVNYDESWTNLGTNSSTGGYAGIGRINCIAFHPSDLNTFWVGSPSGGIWKTTTGGNNWTILNNSQSVLGVSAIVVDYTDPNILYIATGDRDGGSLWTLSGGQGADNASIGVLKSIDGGVTWNTTAISFPTSQGKKVYDLIMHPSNHLILLASISSGTVANSGGVYKTTDGGTTWVKKTNSYPCWRIAFKPGDPTIVYGTEIYSGDQYFDLSTDTGESWDGGTLYGSSPTARRTELAVTSTDPNAVYLLTCNSAGGVEGIHKSTNSGGSFSVVNSGSPAGMLGYYTDGTGGNGGQGSYDWCIAVDPSNANTVFIGGVTTWKSTDGGATFTANNNWTGSTTYNKPPQVPVVHADKHTLVYQSGGVLFEGNDGGIYKSTNGGTSWTDLSNGLVISQLYRISVSQTNPNIVLTGLQDNGTKLFSGGIWTDPKGGDGMECIVDYNNATYMYATYVEGQISRSTNGGVSFPDDISANISGGKPAGAWVAPYIIDPNNSSTLFAGYDQVWKTINRGNTWTSASQQLSASNYLRSLAISPSNSNVLYTADQTHMWKTTTGGGTWSSITLPSTSTSVTYIAVKNTDPNTLWITYGGYVDGQKVYESTNGGSSWTSIASLANGFPNLPVMSIVYYKKATDRNVLFVGTDVGVYVKNGTNNWESFNSGLPNVVVSELEILYTGGGDKLRAGTFGRGLWETNIDAALPVELVSFTSSVKNNSVMLNWSTATEVNNYGFDIERSVISNEVRNLSWEKIGFVNGNGNSNSTKNYEYEDKNINSGKYLYKLKQIDNDGQYSYSGIVEVDLGLPKEFVLSQNYPNPFNPTTTIKWQAPVSGFQTLIIYDVLGNEVSTLVNEYREAGSYEVEFSANNFVSGVYYYQLKAGSFTQTRKMAFVK